MTIKNFIENYCDEKGYIFSDPTGYMFDVCCDIQRDASRYKVKECKKHIFFRCSNTNVNYKAEVINNYLILVQPYENN